MNDRTISLYSIDSYSLLPKIEAKKLEVTVMKICSIFNINRSYLL